MELDDLYQQYVNDLYRYLFSLSKDHYTAEDLVQEAFYRAFTVLENYEIANIKAWLFKVAYHAFIDFQRKNQRTIVNSEISDLIGKSERTPERAILEKESYIRLLEDISSLKEPEKNAILLCDLHDISYQEAAEILELKLNTLKSHLFRGRRKVGEIIKERVSNDG